MTLVYLGHCHDEWFTLEIEFEEASAGTPKLPRKTGFWGLVVKGSNPTLDSILTKRNP
jgi:hypothetical protein